MRLSVAFENTKDTNTVRGPVQVGWFLNEKKGGIIYAALERVRSVEATPNTPSQRHVALRSSKWKVAISWLSARSTSI